MRCVEKIKIAGFRIDSHTIKRGKHVLHYGYLVPLVSSNVKIRLVVSGGKVKTFVKSFDKS
jgi:hypothetical protein